MRKLKKGFTIVELVIVIGVIAILSAILIPTFVNLTSKANKAKASQEVSQAYLAYRVDAEDGHVGDYDEMSAAEKAEADTLDEVAQEKVYIVHSSGAYIFKDGSWTSVLGTVTQGNSVRKHGENYVVAEYNGCSIYHQAA